MVSFEIPEGVCVRRIPSRIESHWATSDETLLAHKAVGGKTIVNGRGRELIVTVKKPKNGGKYLATHACHNDPLVKFDMRYCGIGDSIEEAITQLMNI